jgi:hypothetical protein
METGAHLHPGGMNNVSCTFCYRTMHSTFKNYYLSIPDIPTAKCETYTLN